MNVVGISAFYHESAACLLVDGELVAAAAEERFTRVKHDPRLPVTAWRWCLTEHGLSPADVDCVAYYELPDLKAERQAAAAMPGTGEGTPAQDPGPPAEAIRAYLGYDGPIEWFPHHLSHAASAFYYSGFPDAAVLTADGVGEWATTTYGAAGPGGIDLFEELRFHHSLGLFYATITAYLGFRVNSGEYKVMGLAPYGEPRHVDALRRVLRDRERGQFELDTKYLGFLDGPAMYSPELAELLGGPPRQPGSELTSFHADVACSAQDLLEEVLLAKVRYLAGEVDSPNLCLAGGVALNAVANGRIRREGPFDHVFVQPAAGDAGGCLGAAALAHHRLTGGRPEPRPMRHVYSGPSYGDEDVGRVLAAAGLPARRLGDRELIGAAVDRLAAGRVIGWFQGAMEFGPRALGARSILADPRDAATRERINRDVKGREPFRPLAPSVLAEHAADHFELDHPAPFMTETCRVRTPELLGAVTHVDGSARPQTVDGAAEPRFRALLEEWHRRTGCPVLLNTSLNTAGEPIVMTPADALFCMVRANLDALVIGGFVVDRADLPSEWASLLAGWQTVPAFAFGAGRSAISETLYTFT